MCTEEISFPKPLSLTKPLSANNLFHKSLSFVEIKSLLLPVSSSSMRLTVFYLFTALFSSAGSSTTGWVSGSAFVTVLD